MPEPQALPARNSELWLRVASAAVLAPVAVGAVLAGGAVLAILVLVIAALAYREWTRVTAAEAPLWAHNLSLACLVAGLVAAAAGSLAIAAALIAAPACFLLSASGKRPAYRWMALGLAYVAVPSTAVIVLREAEPAGLAAILFILLIVWATDSAAYFGGRAIGGPKIAPSISPKKTWSGALTGLAAAMLAGALTVRLTGAGTLSDGALLAPLLSAAAQAGDFFESAVKRRFGAKDSGHLIPGHGGVLDRMDGVFGAAALAWLLAALGAGGRILQLPSGLATMPGAAT